MRTPTTVAALAALAAMIVTVAAAPPSTVVPISGMSIATNAQERAYVPLIQFAPGHSTNDNFRVAMSNIFVNRSLFHGTNVIADVVNAVNVKGPPWNAVGNGSADDRPAIQAALNSARGRKVYLPRGQYRISSPLMVTNLVDIVGEPAGVDAGGFTSGAWIVWAGGADYMMIVTNNAVDTVQSGLTIRGLGFYGNTVGKGLYVTPAAHPQVQHSFKLEQLYFYETASCMTFGAAVDANQTDFHLVENCVAERFGDDFVHVLARNFTCVTLIGCRSNARSATTGTHYNFEAGDLVTMIGCAGGYGEKFVEVDYLGGEIDLSGCQWEQSAATDPWFFINTSPGPGNEKPFTIRNCVIQAPVGLYQNGRTLNAAGNLFYWPVYLAGSFDRLFDNGNSRPGVYGDIVNGSFTNGITGWSQTGGNWYVNGGVTNALLHTAGATNAIYSTTPIAALSNFVYAVFAYCGAYGGTNGSFRILFGSQESTTVGNPGLNYALFTNTVSGPVTVGFLPSSDWDRSIQAVTYTQTAFPFVDIGVANYNLSMDSMMVPYGNMMVGSPRGEMEHVDNLYFEKTNSWLKLGNFGTVGNVTINSTTRHAASLYAAGANPAITVENPFGGAALTMATLGAIPLFIYGTNGVYFAYQPNSDQGGVLNFSKRDYITPLGNWILGWAGESEGTVKLKVHGDGEMDTLGLIGDGIRLTLYPTSVDGADYIQWYSSVGGSSRGYMGFNTGESDMVLNSNGGGIKFQGTGDFSFAGGTVRAQSAVVTNTIDADTITVTNLTAGRAVGTDGGLTLISAPAPWTQVTLAGTNAVIDLTNSIPGVAKNFYWATTTSNYLTFSNLVAGAQGTIWINCSATPQQFNFSGSYDNFSTNEIAPVFTVTNRAIIAYKVGWGVDATNVMLAIKRK